MRLLLGVLFMAFVLATSSLMGEHLMLLITGDALALCGVFLPYFGCMSSRFRRARRHDCGNGFHVVQTAKPA
jgi:hypothetical protein